MRALRPANRGAGSRRPVRVVYQRGLAEGLTRRASRGDRHHTAARGVSHADAPVRGAGVPSHRSNRGRSVGGGLVPSHLSHRAEDRLRMAENAASVIGHRSSVAVAIGAGIVLLAAPLAGQTSLSIYGDGRVVMRRSLAQPLEKGRNTLTLKIDALDPATLFSADTGVALVSAVLRPATDQAAALAREMGQTLSFVRTREVGGADTIRATVIRTDPPQFRLPDGRFLLTAPGEPLFPPDAIRTAPEVAITLDATRARPRTDLAYVVSGAARWEAVYQVMLVGGKCQVTGAAT